MFCSCCQAHQNRSTHLERASPDVANSGNSKSTPNCGSFANISAHNDLGRLERKVLVFSRRNGIVTETGNLHRTDKRRDSDAATNRPRRKASCLEDLQLLDNRWPKQYLAVSHALPEWAAYVQSPTSTSNISSFAFPPMLHRASTTSLKSQKFSRSDCPTQHPWRSFLHHLFPNRVSPYRLFQKIEVTSLNTRATSSLEQIVHHTQVVDIDVTSTKCTPLLGPITVPGPRSRRRTLPPKQPGTLT